LDKNIKMKLTIKFFTFGLIAISLVNCSNHEKENQKCKQDYLDSISVNEYWKQAKLNKDTKFIEDTLLNSKDTDCEDFKSSCLSTIELYVEKQKLEEAKQELKEAKINLDSLRKR